MSFVCFYLCKVLLVLQFSYLLLLNAHTLFLKEIDLFTEGCDFLIHGATHSRLSVSALNGLDLNETFPERIPEKVSFKFGLSKAKTDACD